MTTGTRKAEHILNGAWRAYSWVDCELLSMDDDEETDQEKHGKVGVEENRIGC